MGGQHVVVDLAAHQHLGQRMPDQLADAQLPLRGAGGFLGAAVGHRMGQHLSGVRNLIELGVRVSSPKVRHVITATARSSRR